MRKLSTEIRKCQNLNCLKDFEVIITSDHKFCSINCYWESKKGMESNWKGKHHSNETKEKLRQKGIEQFSSAVSREENKLKQKQVYIDHPEKREARSKSRKRFYGEHPEQAKNHSKVMKEKYEDPERRKKASIKQSENWKNPKYAEKQGKIIREALGLKPNKPEKFWIDKLEEFQPGKWKYVGDWSMFIGGKNPDFVNVSDMKIIEFLGCVWHHCVVCHPDSMGEDDLEERIEVFGTFGYETLYIWEHEMVDVENVVKKVKKFIIEDFTI